VPFTRVKEESAVGRVGPAVASARRTFAPGGVWLYAKLYTGKGTCDHVLRDLVHPLVERLREARAFDRWFFIRYSDPDWHLRLRFRGRSDVLFGKALPMLHALGEPLLASGVLWKIVLDTYEPETDRYGGDVGLELAERLFEVDSDACLAIVQNLHGSEDARWQLALRGTDQLLDDLGLAFEDKRALMRDLRAAFGAEFDADTTDLRHRIGARYRAMRKELEGLLDRAKEGEDELALATLSTRSERLAPIVSLLRTAEREGRLKRALRELARSYVHMHVNRLARDSPRAHELVLYDFLLRHYDSRAARSS
jgi:thiopeptide-type bacteriocin biosynthesis protein